MNKRLLIFALFLSVTCAVKKSYEGYKVYNVLPDSREKVSILIDIEKDGIGQFWMEPYLLNKPVKVMVEGLKQVEFVKLMKNANIEVAEAITDLQKVIDDQMKPSRALRSTESFHSMTWDRYHNLEAIYNWLDELVENYPDIVSRVTMGNSNEGREIRGIVINYKAGNENIGVLEGTLHAREWISPAVVTWMVKEFLTSTDPEIRALAENFQWHIFPVVNPDGYVYTFTDNRMWRKNRNTAYRTTCTNNDDDMSNGVDLNRNFGFYWMVAGASANPCANDFAGPSAFSEVESRNIAQYVLNLQNQGELIYYIAFHSYTQLIVVPYSHVNGGIDVLQVINYADMFEIGMRAASKAEERFGTEYRVGVAADILYPMTGTSFDWVKNATNVPVSYLIELRDLGDYGFLLPPEQIIPNSLEMMDFMLEMDKTTKRLGYYSYNSSSLCILGSSMLMCVSVLFLTLI